jgi:hypothetical protein
MDKGKKEQLILLIAVLIFLAILPSTLFKKKVHVPNQNMVSEDIIEDTVQYPVASAETLPAVEPADAYTPDPFDLPGSLQDILVMGDDRLEEKMDAQTEEALPKIEISGIVWGADSPTAFINEGSYKIGDTVDGAKIVAIDKKGVSFLYKDKKILIRMKKDKG